jgi:DNA topoisomerase IA
VSCAEQLRLKGYSKGILLLKQTSQQHDSVRIGNMSCRVYKSRAKNAQEAHEAIRPTRAELDPDSLPPGLDPGKWGGRVE